jgi:hypothetical protein
MFKQRVMMNNSLENGGLKRTFFILQCFFLALLIVEGYLSNYKLNEQI